MEDLQNSGLLYSLFSSIALLLSYAWLIYSGFRAGLPKLPWLITLSATSLLFILGSKVFTVGVINFLIGKFSNSEILTQHSALGGLLFGCIAILFADSYFGFKRKSLDHFALIVPVSMAFQKIGCLVVGCCFGKTCHLPWAIHYGPSSIPFQFHINEAIIPITQYYSEDVHPVQAYLILATLVSTVIAYRTKFLWKQPGSYLLSSMLLMSIARFFTDFFREPYSYSVGNTVYFQLTYIQYGILISMMVMGILLYFNESRQVRNPTSQFILPGKGIAFTVGSLILFFTVAQWFDAWEKLVTFIKFLPIIFILLISLYKKLTISGYRFIPLLLLGITVIFTNQKNSTKPDSLVSSYRSLSGGFSTGNFVNSLTYGDPSGCDSKTRYFKQQHSSVGVGYSVTNEKTKSTVEKGFSVFAGHQVESWQDDPTKEQTFNVFGANGFLKGDRKWFGLGAGMNIGNLRFTYNNIDKSGTSSILPKSGSWSTPIMPSLYFRIGPRPVLFAEYNWAQYFPSPSPGFHSSLAIGSGFGSKSGFNLKIGTFFYSGTFISAYLPIDNKFVIKPLYHFGPNGSPNGDKQRQFSLAFHYRFGHRKF